MNMPDATLVPPSAGETACDVLVIGAGTVGAAIALRLVQDGRQVMLIDRERVAAQASRVNAGALAFSDILPLASPGILRKAPRWLLDPLGPLSIAPPTCRASRPGCSISGARASPSASRPAQRLRRR